MTIRAAAAKKDVYVEKGWCLNLDQAKRMRQAIKDNRIVMQLGHNYNSMGWFHKAREIYRSGELGKVAAIRLYMTARASIPSGSSSNLREPGDARGRQPETIDWQRFTANRRSGPSTPSASSCGASGSSTATHRRRPAQPPVGFGHMVAASAFRRPPSPGRNYSGRTAATSRPVNVLMDYPTKELSVSFMCTFHNRHYGEVEQYLGRDKTLEVSPRFCRTFPAEWKPV